MAQEYRSLTQSAYQCVCEYVGERGPTFSQSFCDSEIISMVQTIQRQKQTNKNYIICGKVLKIANKIISSVACRI